MPGSPSGPIGPPFTGPLGPPFRPVRTEGSVVGTLTIPTQDPSSDLPHTRKPPGRISPSTVATPFIYGELVGVTLVSGSDNGSGADAGSLTVTLSVTDTGAGADAGTVAVSVTVTEVGVGADTGVLVVAFAGVDAGTGLEAGSYTAVLSASDAAIGLELGVMQVTGLFLYASDDGLGVDYVWTLVPGRLTALQSQGFRRRSGSRRR